MKAAALGEHFWAEPLEFRNAFQDGVGMDHLSQHMDWDASLACDSPLSGLLVLCSKSQGPCSGAEQSRTSPHPLFKAFLKITLIYVL